MSIGVVEMARIKTNELVLDRKVWRTYGEFEIVLKSLKMLSSEVGNISVILHDLEYENKSKMPMFTELLDKYQEDIELLMSRLNAIVQLLKKYRDY